MRKARYIVGALSIALAIGAVSSCGGSGYDPTVVRVGSTAIYRSTVEHWDSAIGRGAVPAAGVRPLGETAGQQAISFLISADWLIGEAAEHGVRQSDSQIERRVHEEITSTPGGRAGFAKTLAEVGETLLDAGFEARVQWAATKIHGLLATQVARMTRNALKSRQIVAYYGAHIARYSHPELREFDLAEGFRSVGAARAFVRRHGTGSGFRKIALHESAERPTRFDQPKGKGPLLRAIFAAKLGAVGRPMWLNRGYVVFVLRHIKPLVVEPLRRVRASIEAHLIAGPRRRALAELLAAYERKWIARTDCSPGYVVPKCKQYQDPAASAIGSAVAP